MIVDFSVRGIWYQNLVFWVLLSVVALQSCQQEVQAPCEVWYMENDLIRIEIEEVVRDRELKYWIPIDTIRGSSGGAYCFVGRGNMYRDPLVIDAPGTGDSMKIRFEIFVENPGEYELRVRNWHRQRDGDNDAWLSINGNLYQKIWDHDTLTWSWSEAIGGESDGQAFWLNRGVNTIDLVGRSRGWTVDQVVIFRKGMPKKLWSNVRSRPSSRISFFQNDIHPPTEPRSLKIEKLQNGYVTLAWDASEDNHQIYRYELLDRGVTIAWTYQPKFTVFGLEEGRKYIFSVRAYDYFGNVSRQSSPLPLTAPSFYFQRWLVRSYEEPVVIDGHMDPLWELIPAWPVDRLPTGAQDDASDLSASVRLIAGEEYLYGYIQVIDDQIIIAEGTHEGVELYIDPDNSKTPYYSYDDRIYRFSLRTQKERGEFPPSTALIDRENFLEGLLEEHVMSDEGYIMELAIPWHQLGGRPASGALFGFDIRVKGYDDLHGMEMATALFGYGDMRKAPSALGTLLIGTP